MSTSTTTTPQSAERRMSGAALLAQAMERTGSGNHTAGAKRARAEITYRDAKRASKSTPVAAPVASSAPVGMVDEAGAADLVAQARKVALAIAESLASSDAIEAGGGFVKALIRRRREQLALVEADPTSFLV